MAARLDLTAIGDALLRVQLEWSTIAAALEAAGLGGKMPFTADLRGNMMSAYAYLDELLELGVEPLSEPGLEHMLALNERVHYGTDAALRAEFAYAIEVNAQKFYGNVDPVIDWYHKHAAHAAHPFKLAAETYVSIVGQPQLFVEGNHRTGSLVASWINLHAGYPPFVLSVEDAVAYFAPSAEIKRFADRATWRGRRTLPKYRKVFREFWEKHVDARYVQDATSRLEPPAPVEEPGEPAAQRHHREQR